MPEVKLMTPLFDGGMYNRTGRRMRAVFIKEVADGTTTYRLWRKDGKPEIEYPRCDNDRYILHVEVNSYLIPLRMTEFQMIDNCGYVVMVGTHPLVMRKTKLAVDEVPEGHQFYHYLIDGAVYAGIFVGKENTE